MTALLIASAASNVALLVCVWLQARRIRVQREYIRALGRVIAALQRASAESGSVCGEYPAVTK
jgi:hypothetical protein